MLLLSALPRYCMPCSTQYAARRQSAKASFPPYVLLYDCMLTSVLSFSIDDDDVPLNTIFTKAHVEFLSLSTNCIEKIANLNGTYCNSRLIFECIKERKKTPETKTKNQNNDACIPCFCARIYIYADTHTHTISLCVSIALH